MFAGSYSQSSDGEDGPQALPMFGLSEIISAGVADAEESDDFEDDVDGDSDPSGVSKKRRVRQPPREPVICDVCNKQFTRKAHLVRHMYLHTGEKPFKCNQCQQSFNRKDHLRSHMKGHADAKFKCNHCTSSFSRMDLLRVHVLKNHGKYQKAFKPSSSGPAATTSAPEVADEESSAMPKLGFKVLTCRFCGMKFTQSHAYNRHVASHKRGQVAAEKLESDNEGVDENENGTENIILPQNIDAEKALNAYVCIDSVERDMAEKHIETVDDEAMSSEDDKEQQEGGDSEREHDSSHDGGLEIDTGEEGENGDDNDDGSEQLGDGLEQDPPRKMECVVCGKDNFSDQRALRRHYKVHKRRFICRFCGIKMSSAGSLMRHNMLHTGEKPFKCDRCNRKFSRKDALKAHLAAHEKDNVKHSLPRPFVCTKCNASYTMRYNLIRHMRQCHHTANRSQSGAGGKVAKTSQQEEQEQLNVEEVNTPIVESTNEHGGHQKITINPNDPLRCTHCNKLFLTMKSLSTHIWYHNQDRRFICKVCNRAFKYATDLHRHEMTHNTTGKRGVSINQQRAQNRLALAKQQSKVTTTGQRAPPNHSSIVVNGQRRYPCEYCTVIFNHRSNRSRHVRIFHADQQQQQQQARAGGPPIQQRPQIRPPTFQQRRQLIASKQALLRRQTTVAAIPFNRRRPQPVSRNQLNLKPNQATAIMQAQQLQIRQARQSIESIDADDCEPNYNGNMFKCDLCEKVFDKRYNYKLHLRTHNKQFSCIVCGLKTASQGDLTLHIRTHTGEKPFKCSYPTCEWKFARRSALTVHYRRHHGPNAKIKRQYNPQRVTPNMMQGSPNSPNQSREGGGSPAKPDNSILKTMLENYPCKEANAQEISEEDVKPFVAPVKPKKNLPPPPPLIRYPIPASMMPKKEAATDLETPPVESEKKRSAEVMIFCKPCQQLISGKDNYVDHMLEKHGTTVTAIDSTPVSRPGTSVCATKKRIPPTLLQRPVSKPQPLSCQVCGEIFGSRHDYTVHNLITHCYGTGKFKCGLCQVSVTDLSFLARHYQYVHPQAKNAGEEAHLMISNTIQQDDEMDFDDNMNDEGNGAADMLLYPEVEVVVKEEEEDQSNQNFDNEGESILPNFPSQSNQGSSPMTRKPVPGIMPVDPNLPFPCPLCNKGFKDKKALADHKWYHSREAIYPCTVSGCDKRFKLKNDLIRHLRRHLQTRPFACTESGCESRFYQKSDLARHLNKVHNQVESCPYACQHCTLSFSRPELLVRHMKSSHPQENISHLLVLQMHEKKKRDEEKQMQEFLANLPPEEEEEEVPQVEPEWSQDHDLDYSFELQQLEIDAFDNEDDLTYHENRSPTRRKLGSPTKSINNTTMMEKLANENGVLENGPPYSCQTCSKVFEDRQKFIYHRYYHLRDYRYTCPEEGCGEKFKIKGHVERHIKTYHNSEKPVRNVFHCPITGCTRKFTREYDLSNHIDRMHNGPAEAPANETNYDEMVQDMLEFDNTSQDEENAEETFVGEEQPEYLDQFEESETKPFDKPLSPVASTSILQPCMNRLEEYTNDKGELFCKACNKHFKDLKTLQNHVYYHQRESKHKCDDCGAKFKQKSDLRRHMSIHHDPNKKRQCIPCPNCNRSFTHERYLNIHLNKECDGRAKEESEELDQNNEDDWLPLNPQVDIEEVDESNGQGQHDDSWNDDEDQPNPLMFVSNDVQGDNDEYNNDEFGEEEDEGYDKGHHTQQQNVYECDMCDSFFSRTNELILHRRSVHSEAATPSPPKSRNHVSPPSQSAKGKVKTFTCNKCGMSFLQKAELTQHLQQYHLDELPVHQCQFCPKYFYVKKSLDTHRRRHHSHLLNLIACQICGMKFQAKEYLVSHMKSHHQIN